MMERLGESAVQGTKQMVSKQTHVRRILLMTGIFLLTSSVGYVFNHIGFPDTNIVVIYLLAVLVTAWQVNSFAYGIVASILATFLFNYFFVLPVFTFSVSDPNYIVTLIIMMTTAIITSMLTAHAIRSTQEAQEKEAEIVKERYRANLLRSISHDIRTPLAGIIGISEILMNMSEPEDPRYDLVRGIQKDADWLHSLVENILNLTRLQDGRLEIQKQLEAVEEVVGEAISHMLLRAPEREIAVHIPDELLLVPMDAKLIKQAIINLLDNAIKYTAPSDEIGIIVRQDDIKKEAVFIVQDRGRGISPADLANLFESFYTSHSDDSDSKKGIGLGLAICDTIIKAHGGTISAHNRADGAGAEFIFTLPMEGESHGAI